jgi:pimeloyl-ACP methyl ester carboxylesterase
MALGLTEEIVVIGGNKLHMMKGGTGDPLLILHGAGGNRGWLSYVQDLSNQFTVYLPTHPGFGASDRPNWIETVPDMAAFYTWFQEEQGLENIRAIGFSMGGWLAAEMAATCGHAFSKLMLVGAAGIKPQNGEITDIFIITPAQVNDLTFYDPKQAPEYDQIYGQTPTPEEINLGERGREMAVRVCWKPYMHDPRLPALLERVKIPTRIVWGRQDQLVPLECGELYQKAIKNSELVVIDNCGHAPQIERPTEFVKTALEFLS